MSDWPIRVMLYGAGDAINGANALAPEIQQQLSRLSQVATNRYVAAIAQLDASNVPTLRYVIDPAGRQPVNQLADVDTGDPSELVAFVSWSAAICPAQRSVLVLSGHGAAWEDALVDQVLGTPVAALTRSATAVAQVPGAIHHARRLFGSGVTPAGTATRAVLIDGDKRDYLSNAQLGAACETISQLLGGPIDVLVFDACLMSSWEILQELSGSASTVVAAIDEISAAGIDLASPVYTLSVASGAGDATTIAATIANKFQPQAAFDSCIAINLLNRNWTAALGYFRAFCGAFLPWVQASPANADAARSALRYAATSIVKFTGGGLADIGALAGAIANIPSAPAEAITNAKAAAAALQACVLARATGSDYQAAIGLSIFAPNSSTVYATNRPEYVRLQFPNASGWSAVLDVLYGFPNEIARFLTNAGVAPVPAAAAGADGGDAEFVVSLRGFPIDDGTRGQIEKAINRAVLEVLASIDMLGDVNVTPPGPFAQTRGLRLPSGLGSTAGLVVISNREAFATTRGALPSGQGATPPNTTIVQGPGPEFRVLLRGLNLDQSTKDRLNAAIRTAMLQTVASIDLAGDLQIASAASDPQTRSLLGTVTKILGLILVTRPQV
jgi:Clostripain family